jgi:hypothetical protein
MTEFEGNENSAMAAGAPHLFSTHSWYVVFWTPLAIPDTERELTSWKQIADYLSVNVRTAQKWERDRQLPVRRLPGGRGRVAISAEAIERWRTGPTLPNDGAAFRWPVDRDMMAEVRFVGRTLTSAHVQRLMEFLSLVKANLE